MEVNSLAPLLSALYVSRFPESCFCFDYVHCTLSHMLGHMTSSTNAQLYTIKINKDLLMRLLKRGGSSPAKKLLLFLHC